MKIVNRRTFLALPEGTVFSKFEPCIFGDLMIKGRSIGANDFYCQQIADAIDATGSDDFADKLFDAKDNGAELAMDFYCEARDGLFDAYQLFAVWNEDDVKGLIARLQEAIA